MRSTLTTLGTGSILLGVVGCASHAPVSHQTPDRTPMTTAQPDTARTEAAATDWLDNPLAMRDVTLRWDGPDGFNTGTFEHAALNAAGYLVLEAPEREYPRSGAWTSPEIAADFPLTQVLPSFNLDAPESTGIRLLVRLRNQDTQRWSPWLDLDGWGDNRLTGRGSVIRFDHGEVEIDFVELRDAADALQLRVELVAFNTDAAVTPAVRKVVAVYSGPVETTPVERAGGDMGTPADAVPVDHAVPFLRQLHNGPAMAPRTCSPTSVTMVLRYLGFDADPVAVSDAIYDRRYGLFGNWSRAVAFASTHGLDAELQRFRTWDQLREALQAGPVIASIRFKAGEFPSNQMKQTAGHLIVIRGLNEAGDAIVNDSAYDSGNQGRGVIYKADELARAWLAKGGVGYVIRPATP